MTEERNGDGWWVITFIVGVLALILGVVGIAFAANNRSNTGSAAPVSGGTTDFNVTLADISITPTSVDVPVGKVVTVHLTNKGALQHDFKVDGTTGVSLIDPGAKTDIQIGPFTSDTSAWCTVVGHREAGMQLAIHVLGGSSAAAGNGGGAGTVTAAPADHSAKIDGTKTPAHDWTARDPKLDPPASGSVHEVAMNAIEKKIEVAPGVTQLMWTFNGTVPGPVLHGNVGDTFRITLTNKGTMGHSIDFHASKVAWSDEMRTIKPGESLVYEFKAGYAGVYMYHCGTAPALHHIGNGMYGAIIIDPPGLATVDQEFVIMQSELYLGPEGQPGDLTKMIASKWDAVVFNGYWSQYKFAPIHVEKDKRYRMWVMDDGPNENSAFHIVGTVFDTVFKEGAYLLQPDATHGGSQVLDLQPAQGGFVEFTFSEDGLYPFVTHKFANPGKGALGFFAVGNVDTSALTGH